MGTSHVLAAGCVVVLASAAGCAGAAHNPDATGPEGGSALNDDGATEAPQNPDTTGVEGGGGPVEGGASGMTENPSVTPAEGNSRPTGGGAEIPWSPPFEGRRVFIVNSDALAANLAGYHQFTLVVDADRRLAIFGGHGRGGSTALRSTATGAVRFVDEVTFWTGSAVGLCGSGGYSYDDLSFTVEASGELRGSGHGRILRTLGDEMLVDAATMTLRSVSDTVAPTVGLYLPGINDQLTSFRLAASEPLPIDARAAIRSASGDVISLKGSPAEPFTIEFSSPVLLPYGETYTAEIEGITDFVGIPASAEGTLSFNTRQPPPLAAADGFESVTENVLGGAQILSGAGAPVISGSRSLYVAPVTQPSFIGRMQLGLRLPIAPGDSALRFSYRTVTINPTTPLSAEYVVGSVGGTIVTTQLPPDESEATPAVINGDTVLLGPLMAAAIELPDDADGEVLFVRNTAGEDCGLPDPAGPSGIIIDDLRAE